MSLNYMFQTCFQKTMITLKCFLLLLALFNTLNVGCSLKCYSCNMNGEEEAECKPEITTCGNHDEDSSSEYSCVSADDISEYTWQLFVKKGCLSSADQLYGVSNKQTCNTDLCNNGRNVYKGETKNVYFPELNSNTKIASDFFVIVINVLIFLFTTNCF